MHILFLNQKTPFDGSVKKVTNNLIEVKGEFPQNTSGFHILNDAGAVFGKYEEFTTLYREIEGGFILSNDGSVYVEPEIIPDIEPTQNLPTLEDVQDAKITEMNIAQQETIQAGVNVTLEDGSVEHFTLTDHDQTSLMGLQAKVMEGENNIPWHTSDESQHCKFYSNADMKLITETALNYVTWHVTYFRDLRIYIRSIDTIEEVQAVTYGMDIPEEYQSEPLKVMIVAQKL